MCVACSQWVRSVTCVLLSVRLCTCVSVREEPAGGEGGDTSPTASTCSRRLQAENSAFLFSVFGARLSSVGSRPTKSRDARPDTLRREAKDAKGGSGGGGGGGEGEAEAEEEEERTGGKAKAG